jgi:peptidoglycan/xylan/chitin deacetylase (PgdA/CDA1 family)
LNYFVKTPKILHALYKDAVWFLPNAHNKIYLTFDDGPVLGITDKCLDLLSEYNIPATFFCVGENAQKHPKLVNRITTMGHAIGNHSHSHLKGWKTSDEEYIENVKQCDRFVPANLFRPPYGKAKRSQLKLLKHDYKIIMWDVLSGDFDPRVTVAKGVDNVLSKTESGSIIVMHDNEKCGEKMLEILKEIIPQLLTKGFIFEKIT